MNNQNKTAVIVVAGGKGLRAAPSGDAQSPKQYQDLSGKPVLARAIDAFLNHPKIACVLPVIGSADDDLYDKMSLATSSRLLAPITGGTTRQRSVLAGLEALSKHDINHVLIHDGARPIVTTELIDTVLTTLNAAECALPVVPINDTIKRSKDGIFVDATEDRSQLFAAQTPQGFSFAKILDAHRKALTSSDAFTDDASIAEWAGMQIKLCSGTAANIKITLPEDFGRAAQTLQKGQNAVSDTFETRMGTGMDIHPFVPGDAVILGGISIPHSAKLKGHSDADAALHVLTDAILGALAEGDIGTHFPPSDMKWRGEPSTTFLKFAVDLVAKRAGRIVNLDLTIVCEQPKIGPHVASMRHSIAQICNINSDRVSVKATTSERMGFVGREEGLMTIGAVSIELPHTR